MFSFFFLMYLPRTIKKNCLFIHYLNQSDGQMTSASLCSNIKYDREFKRAKNIFGRVLVHPLILGYLVKPKLQVNRILLSNYLMNGTVRTWWWFTCRYLSSLRSKLWNLKLEIKILFWLFDLPRVLGYDLCNLDVLGFWRCSRSLEEGRSIFELSEDWTFASRALQIWRKQRMNVRPSWYHSK